MRDIQAWHFRPSLILSSTGFAPTVALLRGCVSFRHVLSFPPLLRWGAPANFGEGSHWLRSSVGHPHPVGRSVLPSVDAPGRITRQRRPGEDSSRSVSVIRSETAHNKPEHCAALCTCYASPAHRRRVDLGTPVVSSGAVARMLFIPYLVLVLSN